MYSLYNSLLNKSSLIFSDSDESAEREIGILLSGFNTGNWYQNEEKHFQNGKVNYCKKEEVHKPV